MARRKVGRAPGGCFRDEVGEISSLAGRDAASGRGTIGTSDGEGGPDTAPASWGGWARHGYDGWAGRWPTEVAERHSMARGGAGYCRRPVGSCTAEPSEAAAAAGGRQEWTTGRTFGDVVPGWAVSWSASANEAKVPLPGQHRRTGLALSTRRRLGRGRRHAAEDAPAPQIPVRGRAGCLSPPSWSE